jgi:uncharacterized integral membrane protein
MRSSTEIISETGTKNAEIKAQYKKFIGRKILFILLSITLIFIIAGISATHLNFYYRWHIGNAWICTYHLPRNVFYNSSPILS